MGWTDWFGVGGGESEKTKTTTNSSGITKTESLRTSDRSKENHQHTYIKSDSSGKIVEAGSTPPKEDYNKSVGKK